jgi:hypothetical protein
MVLGCIKIKQREVIFHLASHRSIFPQWFSEKNILWQIYQNNRFRYCLLGVLKNIFEET